MNASAHNQSISDSFVSARVFDLREIKVKEFTKEQMRFDYRNSILSDGNYVVLDANFELENSEIDKIDELMKNPCFRGPINTTYPLVLKTAQILQKHFDTIISDCEKLLDKVDYSGRFDWKARKENVSQVNSIDLKNSSLENFFKRNL